MRKYTFEKVQSYIVILIIKKERKSMQAKKFLATLLCSDNDRSAHSSVSGIRGGKPRCTEKMTHRYRKKNKVQRKLHRQKAQKIQNRRYS